MCVHEGRSINVRKNTCLVAGDLNSDLANDRFSETARLKAAVPAARKLHSDDHSKQLGASPSSGSNRAWYA